MAILAFKVQAEYEEAIRLRDELKRLEAAIANAQKAGDKATFQSLSKEFSIQSARLADITRQAQLAGAQYNELGKAMGIVKGNIAGLSSMMLGGAGLTALATNIVKVRGEVQQFEVAFETMLGSAKKAKDMMADLNELAVKTPFTLPQVVQGAKQLTAYGVEAEEVVDTLRHLGDVAAGLSLPVSRLVGMYGQVLSQGKVTGMTLRRAMMAGIPVTEELAKVMGKTQAEVKSLVTAGKVGAAEFKAALWNMSSEGGKFYNLMDKQAKTITGQISNLGVALHHVFDEIGESQEGPLNAMVGGVANLIEHYKELGEVLLPIVAAYGTYKTSLMLVASMNKLVAESEMEIASARGAEIVTELKEIGIDVEENAGKNKQKMTAMQLIELKRQQIQVELEEIAVQEAAIASQTAYWEAQKKSNAARVAAIDAQIAELDIRMAVASEEEADLMFAQKSALIRERKTFATTMNTAAEELNTASIKKNTLTQARETKEKTLSIITTKADTAATAANVSMKKIWTAVTLKATAAWNAFKVAFATNPVGLALTAISTILMTLLALIPMFNRHRKESLELTERIAEETRKERGELDALFSALKNTEKGTDAHKKAVEKYNAKAKEYNTNLINENDTLDEQIKKYKELKDAVLAANAAKFGKQAKDKNAEKEQEESDDAFKDFLKAAKNSYGKENTTYSRYVREFLRDDQSELTQNIMKDISESLAMSTDGKTKEEIDAMVNEAAARLTNGLGDNIRLFYEGMGKEVNETMLNQELVDVQSAARAFLEQRLEIADKYNEANEMLDRQIASFGTPTEEPDEPEDFEEMSYEQLKERLEKIRFEMVSAEGEAKEAFEQKITQIKQYMDQTLTQGSLASLQQRLSEAKKMRDSINRMENPDSWRAENDKVKRLDTVVENEQKKTYENAKKNAKKNLQAQIAFDEKKFDAQRDAAKRELDLANDLEQAKIDLMKDGQAKKLRQYDLDKKKELEEIDRWYDNLIDEEIKRDKDLFNADPKNKEKVFQYNRSDYKHTKEQDDLKAAKIAAVVYKYSEQSRIANEDAMNDMDDFLKEYGTYEERKLAIAREYGRKIANAESEGERLTLAREREKALNELERDFENNYHLIFGEAGAMSDTLLSQAITATQEAIKRAKSTGDIEQLTELYGRLREQMGVQGERNRGWGFSGIAEAFGLRRSANNKREEADEKQETLKQWEAEFLFMQSMGLDEGTLEKARKKIEELRAEIQKLREDASQEDEHALSFLEKGFDDVASAFDQLGGEMASFRDGLGGVEDAIADIGDAIAGLASHADDLRKAFSEGFSGKNKGEGIAAAVSGTIELISMIGRAISDNKRAQEEWNRTVEESSHKLKMLELDKLSYEQSNIFGVEDPFKKATESAEVYRKSMEGLSEITEKLANGKVQTDTKKAVDWANVGKGVGTGAAVGAAIGSIVGPAGTAIGAAVGTAIGAVVGAIAGFASTKVVPVFESLAEHYGELFDSETYELNPQLLADYDKLDEDTKQIVDHWDEIKEKAEEARNELKENLSDFAGDLGRQLEDTLVNAWKNRRLYSAVDDYKKYVGQQIASILEQKAFSAVFEGLFNDLGKKMEDSFLGPDADGNITDELDELSKTFPQYLEAYNQLMDSMNAQMEAMGYDGLRERQENADASSQSYQQISETTGSAIQGGVTALRISSEVRNQTLSLIGANIEEMLRSQLNSTRFAEDIRNIQVDSFLALQAIRDNTAGNYATVRGIAETVSNIEKRTRGL